MAFDLGGSIAMGLVPVVFVAVIGGVLALIGKPLAKYLFPMLHKIGIKTTGGIIDYAIIGLIVAIVILAILANFHS